MRPYDDSSHPGWFLLELAAHEVTRHEGRYAGVDRRGLDGRGRAVLRITGRQPMERLRGVASAAHALSAEICDQCGSAGDPVRLAADPGAPPATRCRRCRGPADQVLPRPPWRRDRDVALEAVDPRARWPYPRALPVIERAVPRADLAALMDASGAPHELAGWPRTIVGPACGLPRWTVGHGGWNRLLRAAFTVLLPLQCAGRARPLRITQVKELSGRLVFRGRGVDDAFPSGVVDLVGR